MDLSVVETSSGSRYGRFLTIDHPTMSFDPLSPSKATSSKYPDKSTFRTLTRERAFRHPNPNGPDYATHEELVRPHIESFDALTEGDDGQPGLLQLGVQDIGEKVVFDGKSEEGLPFGNKITCACCLVMCGLLLCGIAIGD